MMVWKVAGLVLALAAVILAVWAGVEWSLAQSPAWVK